MRHPVGVTLRRVTLGVAWLALSATTLWAQPVSVSTKPTELRSATAPNNQVVLRTAGYGTVGIQITGTFTATLQFEGSVDCGTYVALNSVPPGSTTAVTSATATGVWTASAAGLACVRVRMSAYTSGTATVLIGAASTGGGGSSSSGSGPTDTDDGSIAGSQTVGIQAGLTHVWTGSEWARAATGSGVTGSSVLRADIATDGQAASDLADAASSLATLAANPSVDGTHDNSVPASGPLVVLEAKDQDGSALPNAVSAEGDAVRAAGSLSGVAYTMTVSEDGAIVGEVIRDAAGNARGANVNASNELLVSSNTELPAAGALSDNMANPTTALIGAALMCFDGSTWDRCVTGDMTIGSAFGTTGPGIVGSYKAFDGSALPTTANVNTEEEANPIAVTLQGIQYGFLTNADGSKQLGKLEDDQHVSADYGLPAWFVRSDTPAATGANGDYVAPIVDSLGRTWVKDGNPCSDPARITHAAISESTAAINEIVALNGSDLIYVCAYKWVTTAANSMKWVRGTGTDCATGTTDIEGAQPYAANGGVAENNGGSPLFVVAAGNALCLSSSAATAHGGRVSYVRTAAP